MKTLLILFVFISLKLTAQESIINGWELLPPQTYDVNNTFSWLENGYQTFKTSGTTFYIGEILGQITNHRKNFSNIISAENKKTPNFFVFDYKISELIGDISRITIALGILENYTYIYSGSMCEVIENPVVDGWKKAKFSTEKIIGIVPTFSKLEFIFCGISKKIGYINFSISIDNLFGEDSLGVRTVYDDFDITDVPVIEQIPSGFILNQNYPNPFNPTTSIMFSSPKESNVSLKIYNILGEEVAELVNKLMPAGNHTIGFDTTGLSSGIYLYRLKAGGFVESKKMILMK